MVEKKAFLPNPKHVYHVSQRGEHDCSANNKKWRLLRVFMFVSIHRCTVIIRKMVERKAFLANVKRQYHVSQ